MVARTLYARPRYLPIVFAFAGDSTITSEVVPDSEPLVGSSLYSSASFAFARAVEAAFVGRFRLALPASRFPLPASRFPPFAILNAPLCCRRSTTNLPGQFLQAARVNRQARYARRIASAPVR